MRLFIEPIDVWLFRDGRPFDAGSDHRAQSLFPPLPSVMAGVVRSKHLAVHQIDVSDKSKVKALVGEAEKPPAGFRLRGPYIAVATREKSQVVGDTRYYPLPADAQPVNSGYRTLQPIGRTDGPTTNLPDGLNLLWNNRQDDFLKEEMGKGGVWLSEDALLEYLKNGHVAVAADREKDRSPKALKTKDLFVIEDRFGIGRDDTTRTTRTGLLYEVGFARLQADVGLEVIVEGLGTWPDRCGILGVGGEARGGRYTILAERDEPPGDGNGVNGFKVYFVTPAYFKAGWQPEGGDWSQWFNGKVELVAAAVGRPLVLGGFDLARSGQKPARRYVPAGSVYYFEGPSSLKENVAAITDFGDQLGFGQFIIGRW